MPAEYLHCDKIICEVKISNRQSGRAFIKSELINANAIKAALLQGINSADYTAPLYIDKVVINLGVISAGQFAAEFYLRLAQLFADELTLRAQAFPAQAEYLAGDSDNIHANKPPGSMVPGKAQLDRIARRCLQAETRQALLQYYPADRLQELLGLLLNAARFPQAGAGQLPYRRATASQLWFAALTWLLHEHRQGVRWLSEHFPSPEQLTDWRQAIISGEITAAQVVHQITDVPPSARLNRAIQRWLLPLWQNKQVRHIVSKRAGKTVATDIAACFRSALQDSERPLRHFPEPYQTDSPPFLPQPQPVSNAGLVLLWPLLPQLFSLAECCQQGTFINENARWQAALCLDWLVWGIEQPAAERLAVNRLLCGIAPDRALPELVPLSPQQQQLTDNWLTAVGRQLPSWQKLSLNDIRALFLQRPGEVMFNVEPPQIAVRAEPFDYLLNDWPWPLTLASLPWLTQPLTLHWPLPYLTG